MLLEGDLHAITTQESDQVGVLPTSARVCVCGNWTTRARYPFEASRESDVRVREILTTSPSHLERDDGAGLDSVFVALVAASLRDLSRTRQCSRVSRG